MPIKNAMELIGEANVKALDKAQPDIGKILDSCAVGYVPKAVRADENTQVVATRSIAEQATSGGLSDMDALMTELAGATTMPALERIVKLRRIAKLAESLEDPFVQQANIEFAGMKAMQPDKKAFAVGGAEVKVYTKAATYEYPAEVKTLEIQFKAAKKTAVANGTAVDTSRPFDPATDRTFAVTV